jgi:hypothetical protein
LRERDGVGEGMGRDAVDLGCLEADSDGRLGKLDHGAPARREEKAPCCRTPWIRGRSHGGPAPVMACCCILESRGGRRALWKGRRGAAWQGNFLRHEQGKEMSACGRGGRREWRLGGRCNFPNWQGEALLFIEES